MHDRQSAFIFYSFGIVAVDKERGSDDIKVTPIEEVSLTDSNTEEVTTSAKGKNKPNTDRKERKEGKTLADKKVKYDVQLPDHQGVSRSDSVEGDVMMVATWTPLCQSNRMTAPDVIEGETVMIFRVADSDLYYWSTMMREPNIRRLETVCYMYGNLPDGINPFDKSSSYWVEVSTHDQHVHLHTAKSNGEPFEYDIKLDTAKGTFELTDNSGNFIHLDSPTSKLTVTTNEDVEVNTTRVVVNASESTTVNSPLVTVNSETTIVNASKEVVANTPDFIVNSETCTLNGSDVVTVNSSQFVVNASYFGLNASSITANSSSEYGGSGNDGSQHRGRSGPIDTGTNGNDETIHLNARHLRTRILEDTINTSPTVEHVSDNITSTVTDTVVTTATNITNEASANISSTAVKVTTDADEDITTAGKVDVNAGLMNVAVTDKITVACVDLEATATNVLLDANFVTANVIDDLAINATNITVEATELTKLTSPNVEVESATKIKTTTPLLEQNGALVVVGSINSTTTIEAVGDVIGNGSVLD